MLCEWRIRKKGSKADPYVDYGAFPTVFCLKINHGGAITPPPKIRYNGGKVNWVDIIDSDVFSVVEVNNMMKELEDDRDDGSNSDDGSTSDNDSNSQDSDFLVDPYNMIDDVDVDMAEFRSNIDANVEWIGSKAIVTMEEEEFKDEGVNHNELDIRSDSEYEEIKEIVTRVAVEQRRELHLKKTDKVRVRCICRGKVPQFGCEDGDDDSGSKGVVSSGSKGNSNNKTKAGGGIKDKGESFHWSLQCSKLPNDETWAVKPFKDTHKCLQSRIVKKCTASFLSKFVEVSIKPNPKIPLNALKDQLQKQYEVGISKQKAFRAKKMAQERVEGPLKDGFTVGKRDLLGLDGCFLSSSYPGWILTTVGVDPNNGIYPLAYAIVESENKDSWKWFLECVGDDLDLFRNSNFTFISDRQKVWFIAFIWFISFI
nr:hypothetical protein [Tanacetum cinerariifolium]